MKRCSFFAAAVLMVLSSPPEEVEGQLAFRDTLASPFSDVASARVGPTGHLVVADRIENLIRVVDPDWATEDTVRRVGQGPGEWREPTAVFWHREDSLALIDRSQQRYSVIPLNGGAGRSSPLPPSLVTLAVRGWDDGPIGLFRQVGDTARVRQMPVVRWDIRTQRFTELAQVKTRAFRTVVRTTRTSRSTIVVFIPFSDFDAWTATPSGEVSVARANETRGEWYTRGGKVRLSAPVEVARWPVTGEDRAEFEGGLAAEFADEWPSIKPPFAADEAITAPNDELWVELSGPHGAVRQYWVLHPTAEPSRITVPPAIRLIAVSEMWIYGLFQDEVGFFWLVRSSRGPDQMGV